MNEPEMNEPEMNEPEMNEIEAALAAWSPSAPLIDRDRLMFAAGRASVEISGDVIVQSRFHFLWPVATSLSTAAALVMAFLLAQRNFEPAAPSSIAGTAAPAPGTIAKTLTAISPPLRGGTVPPNVADGTYLALRNRMLTAPADEWPVRPVDSDGLRGAAAVEDDAARVVPTSRNLLREFLPAKPPVRGVSPEPAEAPAAFTAEHHEAIS